MNRGTAILLPLAALLLAPLLLLQGFYVRAVTPRLPEASGKRTGRVGDGPPLRLLIAGDSAAAGVGVNSQEEALAGRLAQLVGGHREVDWQLVAESGYTSADLVVRLQDLRARPYDTAVISIGVNDTTGLVSARAWRANLTALIELLETRFGAQQVLLSAIPPMHLFPALPQPLRWVMGARAHALNQLMAQVAANSPSATYLAMRIAPRSDSMATDGFHPGAPVYAAWAEAAAHTILSGNEENSQQKPEALPG